MWRLPILIRSRSETALEDNAARAGFAFACCYATAAEYEAELIAARRAAGVYGPKRQQRQLLYVALATAAVVLFVIFA